jgi:hypothetical protein
LIRDWLKGAFQSRRQAWSLEDPSPRLKEAPYTFFLPSDQWLNLLEVGDLVKLIFRPSAKRGKWEAEKMWVKLSENNGHTYVGSLANAPDDMPQIKAGDRVEFERKHIVDFRIANPERVTKEQIKSLPAERREFWDKCFVDDCVIYSGVPVSCICREEPDKNEPSEQFADSGWRILGDHSHPDYVPDKISYVALGLVLNKDDSWIALIDEPIGSKFKRDPSMNKYVQVEN